MRAIARAQPNIALIKYWGKRDTARNLPAVGSISVTLESLCTTMRVDFDDALEGDTLVVNGARNDAMLARVSRCLDSVAGSRRLRAAVRSESNFPIAAGLASSASAFAALVVAADAAAGTDLGRERLASLAGGASGSAARSIYGGIVELANDGEGISLTSLCAPGDWPLSVVVAITATSPKPFYQRWVEQQDADLAAARAAITSRDFAGLAEVAEHNCLKMHSVMWASRPPMVYWNATTLDCMDAVRQLQAEGVPVFFTIDAGPQLKAVCEPAVVDAVRERLTAINGVEQVMVTSLGDGARVIRND